MHSDPVASGCALGTVHGRWECGAWGHAPSQGGALSFAFATVMGAHVCVCNVCRICDSNFDIMPSVT